jgi:hypothetical protein
VESSYALATSHPELVDKLIVADRPKFYPQHHQDILAGLNAVDFQYNPAEAMLKQL